MLIRTSSYVHLTPLSDERVLVLHAVSQLRLVVDAQVGEILLWFAEPRDMPGAMPELLARHAFDADTLAGALAALMERGVLTGAAAADEAAEVAASLGALHGRDPGEAVDRLRLQAREGGEAYWAVSQARGVEDLGQPMRHSLQVLLFGDCELQMESDFLRREGARRGIEVKVAASFPDDLRLATERPHQAILIGALRSRRLVAMGSPADHGGDPAAVYLSEARHVIAGLRAESSKPILIDNLPEPTVQPLGLADRGLHGHRNRFRRVNLLLEELAAEFDDVHVVDIAAALNAEGSARLIDDGLVGFTHFGSPGWMLQRPEAEKAAVHGIVPDAEALAARVGTDPYAREAAAARAHMDVLGVVLGVERKKCVIVDLDGTLWPGVLAETGQPFAWRPEVSGQYSYVGLWFGIHEALKALKRRGILLACVSKNDEALVRQLWRYGDGYPTDRLLTPDDFVTWRVNWTDKAANIASIAEELGFALDAFLFVDDHPVERERVRQQLPEIEVWGEDLYGLRRSLLTDPRLQVAQLTGEAAQRTDLVKAQLARERQRTAAAGKAEFLESLQLVTSFEQPSGGASLERIAELFERTTQFNTTARRFFSGELGEAAAENRVFCARARDRFGDYGLVAAAVVDVGEIIAFAMSCRVIGLEVEHRFLAFVLDHLADAHAEALGRIIETSRNGPVRNLYADNGFALEDGVWKKTLGRQRLAS
jgi:FkbH-like protein